MDIREYKKNLMVVKDIDSDIISEAYFILKSGAEYEYEGKISEEAERIIRECGAAGKKKRRAQSAATVVFWVLACVAVIAAFAVFLLAYFAV